MLFASQQLQSISNGRNIEARDCMANKFGTNNYSYNNFFTEIKQPLTVVTADPGGRAVYGVGLRPFACWDCVFESRWGMDVCLL
jgi:hypothetical protein